MSFDNLHDMHACTYAHTCNICKGNHNLMDNNQNICLDKNVSLILQWEQFGQFL